MSKINFVYTTYPHLGAAYFGTHGLLAELKRIGKLHYSFNTNGTEFINQEELNKYPVLFMNGHTLGKYVDLVEDQFIATYHSESYYTRHGKVDPSGKLLMDRQEDFDLIFFCADSDINRYKVPSEFCSIWADTNVMYPIERETKKDLFFMGGITGREDFLSDDKNGVIKHKQTEYHPNPMINVLRYTDLMNDYLHIVNPPGRAYNGVTGRFYEILACGRLCYQFHNPDTMFKTLEPFEDGKDIVLFKTLDELLDKYEFYKAHESEAWKIAKSGYEKFLNGHTQEHRVKFITDTILNRIEALV